MIEQVVVLLHDEGRKPCGGVAMRATVSWLDDVVAGKAPLQCTACKKVVSLDDVTGDEVYRPEYRHTEHR